MIVVAAGWKRCSRCREFKPHGQFNAKTRHPNGWPRTRQSYCKKCHRERERELHGYQPRKRVPPEVKAEHARLRRESFNARLREDPERLADLRARRRIDSKLQRDRQRGGPPTRAYPLRRTVDGESIGERYRPPSKADTVLAEPLRVYLERRFQGWTRQEMYDLIGGVMFGRGVYRILDEHQPVIDLDFADRLLTIGLGRPDLLNALYPVKAS